MKVTIDRFLDPYNNEDDHKSLVAAASQHFTGYRQDAPEIVPNAIGFIVRVDHYDPKIAHEIRAAAGKIIESEDELVCSPLNEGRSHPNLNPHRKFIHEVVEHLIVLGANNKTTITSGITMLDNSRCQNNEAEIVLFTNASAERIGDHILQQINACNKDIEKYSVRG